MAAAAVIAAFVYIGSFWLHFKLLPLSGEGDPFMTREFQATLPGNKYYSSNASRIPFLENFWYLNWEMLRANSAIETRHPWESKWYEWLYNARGVLYSDENVEKGLKERIYLIVNPVLSVVTALGVLGSIVYVGFKFFFWSKSGFSRRKKSTSESSSGSEQIKYAEKEDKLREIQGIEIRQRHPDILVLLFVSWCANIFPYIGIKRCTFLYHLLPALQLSSLMTGIMLDHIPRKFGLRLFVCTFLIATMCAAFYRWRPWVYALPRTEKELAALRLMPRWD